jgi:type I restriction enzyme M protein
VQEIISKFKLRNQLETMKRSRCNLLTIEKLANKEINISPLETKTIKGSSLDSI